MPRPLVGTGAGTPVVGRTRLTPVYPAPARLRGEEGDVRLQVEVNAEGRATAVSVVHGSGHEMLDRAAVQAAQDAAYDWQEAAGGPLDLEVRFRLDE